MKGVRALDRRRPLPSVLLVAVALAALAAGGRARADHEGGRTLEGEYYWTGGAAGGELRAVFTPTGDGTWEVDFHFRFRGRPHTYSGIAEGSLDAGSLSGTVKNESRRRTFTFAGEFEDRVFEAEHFEVGPAGEVRTGTLTLR